MNNNTFNSVAPAFGPITPDVDTAAFILKHLLVDELYKEDRRIAPVPWRDQVKSAILISRANSFERILVRKLLLHWKQTNKQIAIIISPWLPTYMYSSFTHASDSSL